MSIKKDHLGKTYLHTLSKSKYIVTKVTAQNISFEVYSETGGVPGFAKQSVGVFLAMLAGGKLKEVPNEKKKFKVSVCRTAHRHCDITVEANSQKEAEELALDEVGDHDFSGEKEADYTVQGVSPLN